MCEICDAEKDGVPADQAVARLKATEEERIQREGYSLRWIAAEPPALSFAYTVGRNDTDEPDILIVGALPGAMLGGFLNEMVLEHSEMLVPGTLVPEGTIANVPFAVVEVVDLEAAQMFGVTNRATGPARAVQLVWPDSGGRFPWDEGYTATQGQSVHGVWPR